MVKRGSPGDEGEKNIFEGVEIGDEEAKKLETIQRETARIELAIGLRFPAPLHVSTRFLTRDDDLEREGQKKLIPAFQKRREVLKAIPKFWPVALMRNGLLAFYMTHSADQSALAYLEDVWIEKDPAELRAFKLEFVRLSRARLRCWANRRATRDLFIVLQGKSIFLKQGAQ
jgi:template-activating factor I